MKRRALVTGGAGFIGSHVADLLVEEDFAVAVLDDLSRGRREHVPDAAALYELDIGSEGAATLVREGSFDVICHLAAQIDVRRSVSDPVADARANILGTINLLEAVRRSGRATRVVFSSTGGALYGDAAVPPTPESSPKEPESPYGIGKLSAEYYLTYYARTHGLDTVTLRYANVYGPRQDPHGEAGVVAIFCGRLLDGRAMTLFGDGTQTRDYVYVGDVARANLAAATRTLPPPAGVDSRAFNIGTGIETSVNTLAETLRRIGNGSHPVEYAPARAGEQARSAVSIGKAAEVLDWRPAVSLEQGLSTTFEFFAAQRAGSGS